MASGGVGLSVCVCVCVKEDKILIHKQQKMLCPLLILLYNSNSEAIIT